MGTVQPVVQSWRLHQPWLQTKSGEGGQTAVGLDPIGLQQGPVLSPLLFAAAMDAVSSEAKSGSPSELLYADDLVMMAPIMEQLGRRVTDWRASLLGK